MSSLLLEQLDNSGLLHGREPGIAALERFSRRELLDLLHQSTELTSAAGLSREQSIFSQSASLSLAGDRYPCRNLECRLQQARNLAQYAALYADKVYVYNILANHLARHDEPDEEELKTDLHDDLAILGYLRPLIEAGRVVPITPPDEFCPRCFRDRFAEKTSRKKTRSLHRWLSTKYLDETRVELDRKRGLYRLTVTGPDLLLVHGVAHYITPHIPNELTKKKRIMAKLERGETIELSRTVLESIVKIHENLAAVNIQNVLFELACSQCLGTAFLTERLLHIEALNRLSGDSGLASRNQLIQKHLTTLVPFLSSTRIEDLLRLREQESNAFVVFRQALTQAVDEYRKGLNKPFGPEHARQLYGDVIEPDLGKLDQTVRSATRKLLKGSASKVGAWAGAISFGLYTGLVPAELVEAATALGLTQILAELGTPLLRSRFKKDEVASKDMYFLWHVRELSRQE